MRILLVGSGAREHAIAKAIARPEGAELLSFMSSKNPGIIRVSKGFVVGDTCNPKSVSDWAKSKSANLAVIGPEAPLNSGVSDALASAGIPCVGPSRKASQLECDKSFARNLMRKHKIPGCPEFGIFSNPEEASNFIDSQEEVAIKPAGLTGGKGVKVMGPHLKNKEEAKSYVREILGARVGGIPSAVIEEKLIGEEFTIQAFVDGKNVVPMPAVQDHKLAFDGDKGPNTGGMGSYSNSNGLLPFMTKQDYDSGVSIMEKTVLALAKEGTPYVGFLYGQFIATKKGVSVIEFNARLGDPEAMNVLSLLESDFVQLLEQTTAQKLGSARSVRFAKKASVCKYLVPEGYPEKPKKGERIEVDERAIEKLGASFFYASVDESDGVVRELGSRTVAVLGIADSISEAEAIAEKATSLVSGPLFHRKDIGTRGLVDKRVEHMKKLRASLF